jgi:hypothetical protein
MNKRIKKKWVAALRSGKYEQGIAHLKKYKGYCCLGVLCDLYCKEKKKGWDAAIDSEDHVEYLPEKVQKWAGLKDTNPRVTTPFSYADELSQVNDFGNSFEVIAKYIEESL